MYINWAAPTIDRLIVCGLPSDEYISTGPLRRLIYYLFVDYPPMINIFRLPSEPSSLDLYYALTPIFLGCSSAYEMHVYQFQYSLITCKYINMSILA